MSAYSKIWRRGKFSICVLVFQIIFVVLFAILVEYAPSADPKHGDKKKRHNATSDDHDSDKDKENDELAHFYPMFQDVHVMMFIGFGYLMTFLKRYGFSSVGYNFCVCAFVIQWSTLMSGFLHLTDGKIEINIETMLSSDFACATVLISFGALLGKTSPLQLLICAFLEIAAFQVNEWLNIKYLQVVDVGGSMFVHAFGAYFGLSVSKVLYEPSLEEQKVKDKTGSHYHSDLFAMIGTLFLWMFWPSFNAAVANPGDAQQRAVLNTYYSLCASTLVSFALSNVLDKRDRFDMVHIQNATLAGGVAVGTFADMDIGAWGAMVTGMLAGAVSVLGYRFLTPLLEKTRVYDTCGVNNLHGMPGIIAGLGGIVVSYMANEDKYGQSLYELFPARAPENKTEIALDPDRYGSVDTGEGWSAARQAGMQAAALGVTLAIAIFGGIITGLVLKLPVWNMPEGDELFEDNLFWQIPDEGYPCADSKTVLNEQKDEGDNSEPNDLETQTKI